MVCWFDGKKAIQEIDNVEGLLLALVKMGLILAYFYVCDRTNFFMKENKYVIWFLQWISFFKKENRLETGGGESGVKGQLKLIVLKSCLKLSLELWYCVSRFI